jgi:hypothetical protein
LFFIIDKPPLLALAAISYKAFAATPNTRADQAGRAASPKAIYRDDHTETDCRNAVVIPQSGNQRAFRMARFSQAAP